MPRETYLPASAAARALGISLDTLRRWDRQGRLRTRRDGANRRVVASSEVRRLAGRRSSRLSARNQLDAVVHDVRIDGLLAQVEMTVERGGRMVAVITRDAAEQLRLRPGDSVTAVVKATSVLVER
jgi:molybdopterin-binding protein